MREVNYVGKLENHWQCESDLVVEDGWVGLILLLLGIASVMFVVLTICGHRHVRFPAGTEDITTKRPTWLYRGFTSYEQNQWLRSALLVKRIPCLVSPGESAGRPVTMTLPTEDSADTRKSICENIPLSGPAMVLWKKDLT